MPAELLIGCLKQLQQCIKYKEMRNDGRFIQISLSEIVFEHLTSLTGGFWPLSSWDLIGGFTQRYKIKNNVHEN